MVFIRKHLPDKFYQEGDQRVSLRDRIFREITANLLVHREFTNAYPAKFIIEEDQVTTENWNRPHGNGKIDPEHFSSYPKNPAISRFFKEIGRVEELGSGVRNAFKYMNSYVAGARPIFIEDDVFKTIIPLKTEDGERLGKRLGESEQKIIQLIRKDAQITIVAMAEHIGISTTAIEKNINTLKEKELLVRMGPTRGGYWKITI
jgi:ATP-dependent DNA helicase RecG